MLERQDNNGININIFVEDFKIIPPQYLKCTTGKLVVEMLPPIKKLGAIILPEQINFQSHLLYSDIGVVISTGSEIDLNIGDYVIVHPLYGTKRSITIGEYSSKFYTKFLGVFINPLTASYQEKSDNKIINYDYKKAILATIKGPTMEDILNMEMKGDNLLIIKDPVKTQSDGGVLLPDRGLQRSHIATVIKVGPDCKEVKFKDRIFYHPYSQLNLVNFDAEGNWAIISETAVEGIIG